MIRPDGKPLHPDDGWEDEGHPLTFQWSGSVKRSEWDGQATVPWNRAIMDHKRVPAKDAAPLWSFCLVNSRARESKSVTHVTTLVYDFDAKGGRNFVDVVDGLLGVRWFAHTTFSHTDENHCFRVILPVSEAIPVELHRDALEAVADALGFDGRDPACKDPARLYYVPSCAPDASPWLEYQDGDCIDWRGWLESRRRADAAEVAPPVRAPAKLVRSTGRAHRDTPEYERVRFRAAARRMLELRDPDCNMLPWLRTIFAIVDGLGHEGYQMVDEWSARGTKYNTRQMASLRRRLDG